MNGTGLLYKDHETAEAKAGEWRSAYLDLLARLHMANSIIDSLQLDKILREAEASVRTI